MKRVTFLFQDERDLHRFLTVASCTDIKMNVMELTLVCLCDDAEIELAQMGFSAQIVSVDLIGI